MFRSQETQDKSKRHEPKIECELEGKANQNVIATQQEKKNDTKSREIMEKNQRQVQHMKQVKEEKDDIEHDKEDVKSKVKTVKQTKIKKSKQVRESFVDNLLKPYKQHGLLPDRKNRPNKTPSGFIGLFKFQEEFDQFKNKVSRLIDLCKHRKQLKADVFRLMTYGNKLERCSMCIVRQTHSLRKTIERLNEMKKLEHVEIRNELELELEKHNEILEPRKKRCASWSGVYEPIRDKWSLVDQKFKKEQSTLTFFIKTKMDIYEDVCTMDNQIKSIDIRYEKIIEDLYKELDEIKTRIGQGHKDASKILQEMMENNGELIKERNRVGEDLDKTKADLHFSREQYERELAEMRELKQDRECLDKRLIEQIDEVTNSVTQVNTLNREIDKQTEVLRELEKQNEECVGRMRENEQYKELLNMVKENIEASKREIRELVNEHVCETAMKERLEKPQELRINDETLEALEDLRLDLELEIDMLQENWENLEGTQTILMLECSKWKRKIANFIANFEQRKLYDIFKNSLCKIQTEIDEEKERRRKLLTDVEELEQSAQSHDKQMEKLISEKESFTHDYEQVMKNMKELDQYKDKKRAHIVFLEKEINITVRKKQTLMQNCDLLEDNIKEALKAIQTYEKENNIEGENEELEQKLAKLNYALEEELLTGEEYKQQFETLSNDKSIQDVERLTELRNNEKEYVKLEEENQKLDLRVNDLRLRYQDLKNWGEVLKRMIKEEKEKRNKRKNKK